MKIQQFLAASTCAIAIFGGTIAVADSAAMSRAERMAQAATVVQNYNDALPRVRQAWPGFDPVIIPKIIVMRDATGTAKALIAFDHPNPDQLGEAVSVETAQGVVHIVFAPNANLQINDFEHFEFSRPVAGAPTFLIASNCSRPDDPTICAETRDFSAYFMHEVFHRYQDDAFQDVQWEDQGVYNYNPAFVYATLIENQLFVAAEAEQDADALRSITQDLVAVRAYRHAMSDVAALDEAQERIEGTANFVEDRATDDDAIPADFLTAPLEQGWVREELGFGRFYVTGRIAVELAQRLGSEDYAARLTARETPMELLASLVEPVDPEEAFERAVARFDPQGTLLKDAARYAAWAENEPGLFDY